MRNLISITTQCRKSVLDLYKKANAGHIGSSLSCLEILVYLFFERKQTAEKVILSKGHAAVALYAVLEASGCLSKEDLQTFYMDGTNLAAHPPCNGKFTDIPFGTGSLGHGLSLATGFAFAQQFTEKKESVFCILSEGDCNEGSTWEAILFAAQHQLSQLTFIIDHNDLQGFGFSNEVLNLEPLAQKFLAFGCDVAIADKGNDFDSLRKAFCELDILNSNKPRCIIANTIKGHGISFMENELKWHYLPMTEEQYQQAIKEIEL